MYPGYLYNGLVSLIDPVCFPHLMTHGETPDFFDTLRYSWMNNETDKIKGIISKLRARYKKLKKIDQVEKLEIKAMLAILIANRSHLCRDWRFAHLALHNLADALEQTCSCQCYFTVKAAAIIRKNADKCGYFATSI